MTGKQRLLPFKNPAEAASNSSVSLPGRESHDVEQSRASAGCATSVHDSSIKQFMIGDEVTKAEILWAFFKVSSDRSEAAASDLFPVIFSDSAIAQKFHMQKDKLAYMITYGLGPYFQNVVVREVKTSLWYAASFDESLNKVAQQGQMDIVLRYWNSDANSVSTKYLTSAFLGHNGCEFK